ncbi:hypothetical protein [Endozoicomonas ascidiicola]|uniref:hypothetical protein n=1 Tax=Endozoicomonas ascidiicola TaxID=1698521 RepID=UPI000B1D0C24|nr:hypothetical protein [Endozoicomonas ascidiicola]
MATITNNNLDLFGDLPTPPAGKKKVDPKACPVSYLKNDEVMFSRPDRNLNQDEWDAIHDLTRVGISAVWAAHFVLFEGVRTVAQFLAFEPDEQWGTDSVFRLNKRKAMVRETWTP